MTAKIKFKNEKCPVCKDGAWVPHADGVHSVEYVGQIHKLAGLHYMRCDKCGTNGFNEQQAEINQQRIAVFESGIYGYISREDINAVRATYRITKANAAKLYGVSEDTYISWENGTGTPPVFIGAMMREMLSNANLVKRLVDAARIEAVIQDINDESAVSEALVNLLFRQKSLLSGNAVQRQNTRTNSFISYNKALEDITSASRAATLRPDRWVRNISGAHANMASATGLVLLHTASTQFEHQTPFDTEQFEFPYSLDSFIAQQVALDKLERTEGLTRKNEMPKPKGKQNTQQRDKAHS